MQDPMRNKGCLQYPICKVGARRIGAVKRGTKSTRVIMAAQKTFNERKAKLKKSASAEDVSG